MRAAPLGYIAFLERIVTPARLHAPQGGYKLAQAKIRRVLFRRITNSTLLYTALCEEFRNPK